MLSKCLFIQCCYMIVFLFKCNFLWNMQKKYIYIYNNNLQDFVNTKAKYLEQFKVIRSLTNYLEDIKLCVNL